MVAIYGSRHSASFRENPESISPFTLFFLCPFLLNHFTAIYDYLNGHNQKPRAFVWTATAESILAKIN
jgi:hypothetical protein